MVKIKEDAGKGGFEVRIGELSQTCPSLKKAAIAKNTKAAALRAGRDKTDMWSLMLWTYCDEMVRSTCGSDFRPGKVSKSTMAWAMASGSAGIVGESETGCDFAACCDLDALEVHGAVLRVIDEHQGEARRAAFQLLIMHAGAEAVPTWNPTASPRSSRTFGSAPSSRRLWIKFSPPTSRIVSRQPTSCSLGRGSLVDRHRTRVIHAPKFHQ